jgi:FkbM family methyltransferase
LENKQSLLETLYHNLHKIGFTPKHIVDIGANHGTWTREALKHFPEAHYTLIEPQKRLRSSMEDLLHSNPKIQLHNVGAGSQVGSFSFTIVDRDDSCNFLMSKEEANARGFEQIEVPVTTLDTLLENSTLPIPDLIKIDAEGLDLEVLKGAQSFLGKTEIILVEAAVFNKTMPNTAASVITYMDQQGYTLFEVTDLNRPFSPPLLWLIELAFIKKGGIIDSYNLI